MPGTLLLRAGDEKKLELGAGRPDLEAAQRRDDSRSTHVDAPVGNHADAGSIPAASTSFDIYFNYLPVVETACTPHAFQHGIMG